MASAPRPPLVPNTPWRTFQEEPPPPPPSKGIGVLGGLAIAVGLGVLSVRILDLHGHTCDKCGQRWRHFGAFNLNDEPSHTCSSCGEVQWWKCGAPHVLRGSEFVTPSVPTQAVPYGHPTAYAPPSASAYASPGVSAYASPGVSAYAPPSPASIPPPMPAPMFASPASAPRLGTASAVARPHAPMLALSARKGSR